MPEAGRDLGMQKLPLLPHVTLPPAVNKTPADSGEDCEESEQEQMSQIAIGNDMRQCPKRQCEKYRVPR